MDTNRHESENDERKLIFKDEVFQLVGCAMEVLNGLGHGLHEKIYENALVVEFHLRGIAFDQQRRFDVLYKNVTVGEFIPDLITHGTVVADTKVIDRITDHERGQMINYDYDTKPIELPRLREKIEKLLGGQPQQM